MEAKIEQQGEKAIITISGRLDSMNSGDFEKTVEPILTGNTKDVEVNCVNFEYISSSGLRIFLSILKSVKSRGGSVLIRDMNADLRGIFDMCGFSPLFKFE
ncbi:MAG: STAS domain-containing protein [Bacteroidales bacterium]|jgi:anti-sigma B factor antagonist|nr:STAS domain-containing protein [Bacteroidales bacterium]MDD3200988.1 STAS domain-containing protein [Bacteroidales bacterium]